MMYFKFLLNKKGEPLFFSKKIRNKDLVRWIESIKKVSQKEEIHDVYLEDFLKKMRLSIAVEFTMDSSKIKIYENKRYRFFEITNSNHFYLEKFERVIANVKDKKNAEYILIRRE